MSAIKKVYTLLLEDNHYYVGITKDVLGRFEAHRAGTGAAWTKLHKPIEIIAVEEAKTPFDEDRVVKTLMHEHGIEKVRGGSYVTIDLSAEQIKLLRKEITMSTGACIICGEMGHMAKVCPSKTGKTPCARCGRVGHDVEKCFAKKSKTGEPIVDDNPSDVQREEPKQAPIAVHGENNAEIGVAINLRQVHTPIAGRGEDNPADVSCTKCGWGGHEASTCFAKRTKTGEPIIDVPETITPPKHLRKKAPKQVPVPSCTKCGRGGHDASTCFAKRTKTGEPIADEPTVVVDAPEITAPPKPLRKKAPKPPGFEPPVFEPPSTKKEPDVCSVM